MISEDLSNGVQELFYNPVEEISTIAIQHDEKVVAVGSSYNPVTKLGPIFIWDLANKRIEKVSLGIIKDSSFHHHHHLPVLYHYPIKSYAIQPP